MMSSLVSSNPAVNSDRSSMRRKKRKKINHHAQIQTENLESNSPVQWKSDAQQQIYSSKLLHALQQVRLSSSAAEPRRVRDAAYGVLAATARGRSRWSRAILTNRLKLKFMKKSNIAKRQRKVMTVIAAGSRSQKKSKVNVLRLKSKCLPAFQRKARVLSRLVPGCRKQPLPVVLDEATDYIAALEMQVRAMSALAELLSVSGSSSSGSAQLGSIRAPPS
ncbi:sequence-specific DNA binding transcription factor [Perilla frutescens var. hirtella]|uniref:Sequence-specific DNA binding transcription factor n=1 Tax=Perilla frutescens var. hirtella TaxID=608512 RepID=A0AAD4JEA6_PERFH|nr:sequence-specific DNA binding transcription factor [Perilla frutescens var. hirtella]